MERAELLRWLVVTLRCSDCFTCRQEFTAFIMNHPGQEPIPSMTAAPHIVQYLSALLKIC